MGTKAIRWGLMGTSRINEKLLRGARLTDAAEVIAVGSRSQAAGDAFAAQRHPQRSQQAQRQMGHRSFHPSKSSEGWRGRVSLEPIIPYPGQIVHFFNVLSTILLRLVNVCLV